MTRPEFNVSLSNAKPPEELTPAQAALWWLANSNWQAAHELIDQLNGPDNAWVHAHLHRIEGDEFNANYWYRRAGRDRPDKGLGQEREELLNYFFK